MAADFAGVDPQFGGQRITVWMSRIHGHRLHFEIPDRDPHSEHVGTRRGQIAEAVELPVIAAGGVNSIEDIKKLAAADVAGAIIGRALYEGTLDLAAALEAVK